MEIINIKKYNFRKNNSSNLSKLEKDLEREY